MLRAMLKNMRKNFIFELFSEIRPRFYPNFEPDGSLDRNFTLKSSNFKISQKVIISPVEKSIFWVISSVLASRIIFLKFPRVRIFFRWTVVGATIYGLAYIYGFFKKLCNPPKNSRRTKLDALVTHFGRCTRFGAL